MTTYTTKQRNLYSSFVQGDTVEQRRWKYLIDTIATPDWKINLNGAGGAESASGLLMGVGTTSSPASSSTANDKFIEVRAKTTATSGDNRLMYLRYEQAGANSTGGECIRAFTKLSATVGTARGAHISLDYTATTGQISGLGVGLDAQLLLGGALTGGTHAVINAEIYSGAATSDPGGNVISYFRVVNGGNASGKADVDDDAFLFELSGFTSGAAHMWYDNQGAAPANIEEWLKVKTPGGTRYLALYNAVV